MLAVGGNSMLSETADHADRVVRVLQFAPRPRHEQRLQLQKDVVVLAFRIHGLPRPIANRHVPKFF